MGGVCHALLSQLSGAWYDSNGGDLPSVEGDQLFLGAINVDCCQEGGGGAEEERE